MTTTQPPLPDDQLMQRVAEKCEPSLAELYDRHAARLYGICLKILRRPAEAQAVLSDVFYEIWRRADRFNPERGSVRTYFATLARSRAIDRLRAEATRSNHEAGYSQETYTPETGQHSHRSHSESDPLQTAIHNETLEFVRETLDGLPAAQQTCLEIAYFEGLTQKQIAERLDMPLGTVKTHIRTGLEKLRSAVAAHEAGTRQSTNKPR